MENILKRRRAMIAQTGGATPILPAEYQQVEWIGSNGSQTYIDSGVILTNDSLRIKTKVQIGAPGQYFKFICGQANNSSTSSWVALYKSSSKKITFKLNGNSSDNSIQSSETTNNSDLLIDAFVSGGDTESAYAEMKVEENGVSTTYSGTYAVNNYAKKLWIMGTSYQAPLGLNGKMYFCTVWNGGEKVFDGIPCYRKSDSVIGLYDLVSETFKTNSGTGTFTKGANVTV